MEFQKLIHKRKSTHRFTDEPLSKEEINRILDAGQYAPIGSCFMWFALDSMRRNPELDRTDLLGLPEGFEPLLGLAVGHIEKPFEERSIDTQRIARTVLR